MSADKPGHDVYTFPWKNIGKDIGKKLRDVIRPPADSGPTREQRKVHRLADKLKGFTYLDSFDELTAWKTSDSFESQRASVPLFQRSGYVSPKDGQKQTRLLLCNDYQGGFHSYESTRPPSMQEPMYFCNYMQHVDIFIYFSHKLVSCPPPTWTNALHRNGVKVFATFIIEPGTDDIERMFDKDGDSFVIAEQLAAIAEHLGFDGWLLNIENHFSIFTPDPTSRLVGFIECLRELIGPDKELIWYDALTQNNEVDYQNRLSSRNERFAKAAGMLFTNYAWTESHITKADAAAQWFGITKSDIFFGIDMWAQNNNMPGPKRVTYPEKGGGGTMTGFAVKKLAEENYAAAVLAPAWACEHFSSSVSNQIDQAVWEGNALPEGLHCDCQKVRPHHINGYRDHPLAYSAKESPAGTSRFFESDFRMPFEEILDGQGGALLRSRLGSMQPRTCLASESAWTDVADVLGQFTIRSKHVSTKTGSTGRTSSHLQVLLEQQDIATTEERSPKKSPDFAQPRLPLFKLSMLLDQPLIATIICKTVEKLQVVAGAYFCYSTIDGQLIFDEVEMESSRDLSTYQVNCRVDQSQASIKLIEFGVFCKNPVGSLKSTGAYPILDIHHLSITQTLATDSKSDLTRLTSVRAERRGEDSHEASFLVWEWVYSRAAWPQDRPWSRLTGPYEWFEIEIEGRYLGEAFSSEFMIQDKDLEGHEDAFSATIWGKIFGEAHVAELWHGVVEMSM